ncbi:MULTISPECIES: EpsG family protein [unclassified Aliivibrio]|uniref:EpsG family protein n=1 Tax=unclassified Aliivibrio TaxID=2645654 RepID=UPI0023788627|nr:MULTISPECIES: EpsG family protein [unclassified Aliivibrio]MDD9185648.1 EpsG family protein [Aliivibrio sp. S4MY3]MDD9202168.1 EpsG family protein [Aliivibrio sp. S4MY1]
MLKILVINGCVGGGVIILYCIFFSFRTADIGSDAGNYVLLIDNSAALSQDMSPMIKIIASVVGFLGGGEALFFFAISMLICITILYAFYRLERKDFLVVFATFTVSFLFVNINVNIFRQGIAIAFGTLALSYLIEKRYIKYLLFVILATFTHTSAVILLLSFMLVFFMRSKCYIFIYIACCAVFYMLDMSLAQIVFHFKENHWSFARLYWYLTWNKSNVFTLKHIYYLYLIIIIIFLSVFERLNDKQVRLFLVFLTIPSIMTIFRIDAFLVDRFTFYFIPVSVLLTFQLFKIFNLRNNVYVQALFVISLYFWLVKSILQFNIWWGGV